MTNPWNGPRHRSWASDTVIFAVVFIVILIITVVTDALNGPDVAAPAYLTGLLGASATALFGAAASDKSKREAEIAADTKRANTRATSINETAVRAEAKVDHLIELAKIDHPEVDLPDRLLDNGDDHAE